MSAADVDLAPPPRRQDRLSPSFTAPEPWLTHALSRGSFCLFYAKDRVREPKPRMRKYRCRIPCPSAGRRTPGATE